MTLKVVTRYSG